MTEPTGYVWVLWQNEHIDSSTIHGVYSTEPAARAAYDADKALRSYDIEKFPFYE